MPRATRAAFWVAACSLVRLSALNALGPASASTFLSPCQGLDTSARILIELKCKQGFLQATSKAGIDTRSCSG